MFKKKEKCVIKLEHLKISFAMFSKKMIQNPIIRSQQNENIKKLYNIVCERNINVSNRIFPVIFYSFKIQFTFSNTYCVPIQRKKFPPLSHVLNFQKPSLQFLQYIVLFYSCIFEYHPISMFLYINSIISEIDTYNNSVLLFELHNKYPRGC